MLQVITRMILIFKVRYVGNVKERGVDSKRNVRYAEENED
jgi:hypothetical protein